MIKLSGLANCLWVSDPIHIGSFFEYYKEKLPPEIKSLQTCGVNNYELKTISSVMGTSQTKEQFHEVISYCAEDKLDVPDEPCSLNVRRVTTRHRLFARAKIPPPEICGLTTLKNLRQIGKEREGARGLKYSKAIFINNERKDNNDLHVKNDIVITIRVHDSIYPNETSKPPVKPFSQELMVLGSQTLTDLRDTIICSTDYTTTCSETESLVHENEEKRKYCMRAKDVFKSGYFCIEDTFYNDMRDPTNIDYSEVIRNWARGKNIGPFHECSMSEMKLEDLTVRFGYPYIYQHQGNCEHLIVFSDASLLHESDVCEQDCYPLLKAIGGKKPQECMVCYYYYARWITFGNKRVPVDPCYFCEQCFKSYNFKDEIKIGQFKMYEYHPFLPIPL